MRLGLPFTAALLVVVVSILASSRAQPLCGPSRLWQCDAAAYGAGDGICDCGCGVYDPDCAAPGSFVVGCGPAEANMTCGLDGACTACTNPTPPVNGAYTRLTAGAPDAPARCDVDCEPLWAGVACDLPRAAPGEWTCDGAWYNSGDGCDCGCGARDPDCDLVGQTVTGCGSGETCSAETHTCAPCSNPIGAGDGSYAVGLVPGNATLTGTITNGVDGQCASNCTDGRSGVTCSDVCALPACTALASGRVASCLRTAPLDPQVKAETLDVLRKMLPLYVFADIARDSPDPVNLPSNIDLAAELDAVEAKEYDDDFTFQQEVSELYKSLNDAHTRYLVSYLGDFYWRLPIELASYVDGASGDQVVVVSGVDDPDFTAGLGDLVDGALAAAASAPANFTLTDLIGATVVTIDGDAALDHLIAFADSQVGVCRDISTRFNLAGRTFGSRSARYNTIPEGEAVEFVFAVGDGPASLVTVTFPWYVVSFRGIGSEAQYAAETTYVEPEENALPGGDANNEDAGVNPAKARREAAEEALWVDLLGGAGGEPDMDARLPRIRRADVVRSDTGRASNDHEGEPHLELIVSDGVVSFFQFGNETGILKISSFSPDDAGEFRRAVEVALLHATDAGLTNLMLDLRDNGGGSICLGYALSQYLWPEFSPYGEYDLAAPPVAHLFGEAATATAAYYAAAANATGTETEFWGSMWYYGFWYDEATGALFDNFDDWWGPVQHTRGGVEGDYTNLFHDDCHYSFDQWTRPTVVYQPDHIMLLSAGYCGSTCAVFSTGAEHIGGAITVAVGGIAERDQMTLNSFPGGQVYRLSYVLEEMEYLNVSAGAAGIAPSPLPTRSLYAFALREIYWDGGDVPAEWTYVPADHHIAYTNESWFDDAALYASALPYFTACEYDAGNVATRACSAGGGTGAFACQPDGHFSSVCVLDACPAGAELVDGACQPCGRGTFSSTADGAPCTACDAVDVGSSSAVAVFVNLGETSSVCEYVVVDIPTQAPSGTTNPASTTTTTTTVAPMTTTTTTEPCPPCDAATTTAPCDQPVPCESCEPCDDCPTPTPCETCPVAPTCAPCQRCPVCTPSPATGVTPGTGTVGIETGSGAAAGMGVVSVALLAVSVSALVGLVVAFLVRRHFKRKSNMGIRLEDNNVQLTPF